MHWHPNPGATLNS
jgi:mediator of RNA polymerase II transcription subunit 20